MLPFLLRRLGAETVRRARTPLSWPPQRGKYCRWCALDRGGGSSQRHAEREFAALADTIAAHLHRAAVQFHQCFDDGQADTKATFRAMTGRANLDESIENAADHV